MNLPEKSKKFEEMVTKAKLTGGFDFAKAVALAEKFEKKFIKSAQDAAAAKQHLTNVLTKMYRTLTGTGTDQASVDLAMKTLFPVIESMPSLSEENALAQAEKMYQYAIRNNRTHGMAEELFSAVEGLRGAMSSQPAVPAPSEQVAAAPAQTPAAKKVRHNYPRIDSNIQRKLNKLLGTNLDPDGDLGPLTTAALEKAKGKLNLSESTSLADTAKAVSQRVA